MLGLILTAVLACGRSETRPDEVVGVLAADSSLAACGSREQALAYVSGDAGCTCQDPWQGCTPGRGVAAYWVERDVSDSDFAVFGVWDSDGDGRVDEAWRATRDENAASFEL